MDNVGQGPRSDFEFASIIVMMKASVVYGHDGFLWHVVTFLVSSALALALREARPNSLGDSKKPGWALPAIFSMRLQF